MLVALVLSLYNVTNALIDSANGKVRNSLLISSAQFFVLSTRGDAIISLDYRHDVSRFSHEVLFRSLKFGSANDGEVAPVFLLDGVNYFHVKAGGLILGATSRENLSPSLVFELLHRIAKVIKDYCGVLNEESLRKNFVLVYELLDEMLDYGYGQSTSTEALKASIFNDPVAPLQNVAAKMPGVFGGELRMSSAAANRSVINRVFDKSSPGAPPAEQKSEIFVDIIERLTMTFNGAGYMMTSEIDGAIQCKSFLAGNPQIRLALNENLVIGGIKDAGPAYESSTEAVLLDDCSFHERVAVDNFESDRTLLLSPPAGEFIVMNYRCAAPFRPPFRVTPQVTEPAPNKLDVVISLSSEFAAAKAAVGVVLRCPLPKCTSHVSLSVRGEAQCPQKAEYDEARHELVWTFKKLPGAQEHVVRCRCTLTQERVSAIKKEVGPVSLVFTLPNFNVSRLAVRFLQILAKPRSPNEPLPQRWVRYVTQSSSYVCRL